MGPTSTGTAADNIEQRRGDVKARLQRAMLELIEGQSFRDLRIESIAEAAGLSRSAFYFYYKDKYELLQDVAAEATFALYEQAATWWQSEGEAEGLIQAALNGCAEIYDTHRKPLRLVTEVSTYEEEIGEFWAAVIGRFIDATADYIRREQDAGRADRAMKPHETAQLLVWGAERTLYIEVAVGGRPAREISDAIAVLWLRVIGGGNPTTS